MRRRGPDSFGYNLVEEKNKNISLFFSRLSIIDQVKRSNQPFAYKDKVLMANNKTNIRNILDLKKTLELTKFIIIQNNNSILLTKAKSTNSKIRSLEQTNLKRLHGYTG